MWKFKFTKPKPVLSVAPETVVAEASTINIDCVYLSILNDLEPANVNDWACNHNWYGNQRKGYIILCNSDLKTATVARMFNNIFTTSQERTIYKKCKDMERLKDEEKSIRDHLADLETLKSNFPHCVSPTTK